jgi:hypothetical protein
MRDLLDRVVVSVVAFLILVVVLGGLVWVGKDLGRAPRDLAAANIVPVVTTPSTTVSVSKVGTAAVDPFANSPARTWLDAANGVVMPAPTQLGPYPTDVVATALQNAYRYLIDARTDPTVITDHDMTPLNDLMDERELARFVTSADQGQSGKGATLLAAGTKLLAPVRVNGTVVASYVAEADDEDQHIAVTTDLVWAYALTSPDSSPTADPILVVHENRELDLYIDCRGCDGKVWVRHYKAFDFNIDCETSRTKKELTLPRRQSIAPVPTRSTSFNPNQKYDPNTDISTLQSTCEDSTATATSTGTTVPPTPSATPTKK